MSQVLKLWDPQVHKVIVSCDVIFNEHPKPPALLAPPADLSQILYNGELPGDDTPGITQVGDALNKPDRQNIWLVHMPHKKLFGYVNSLISWVIIKRTQHSF